MLVSDCMVKLLHNLRNGSTATVILLLIALALLTLTVHRAIDEHAPGQSCELCIGLDRLGDANTAKVFLGAFVVTLSYLAAFVLIESLSSCQPASLRCRAPPFSLFH
jgi:uncharacterized membrane protein YhaH (DUF805 family)